MNESAWSELEIEQRGPKNIGEKNLHEHLAKHFEDISQIEVPNDPKPSQPLLNIKDEIT